MIILLINFNLNETSFNKIYKYRTEWGFEEINFFDLTY
jgi:hypothetical protein